MIRFKPEVHVAFFTDAIVTPLRAAAQWSALHGVEVLVNSIDDAAPNRLATTLHGYSLAIDIDVAGDAAQSLEQLANYLARVLPAGFDVVFEASHVHVEFDMHRGALKMIAG